MTKKIYLLPIVILLLFGFFNSVNANELNLYSMNNDVHYDCPSGTIHASDTLDIDVESVSIINDIFFKDKNSIYHVSIDSHSQICFFQKLSEIEPETFIFINNYYQKDKNNAYFSTNYWGWGPPVAIENVDLDSFEVLKEDGAYAMDKNNMYLRGKKLSEQAEKISDDTLYKSLKGKIILKVESNGEAYYIHPSKQEMHFLSRPVVAFHVMREQGVGITNNDLEKIPVADNYCPSYLPACDKSQKHNLNFTKQHLGKIFLQVEESGEAWYVNPENNKRYFLGRPSDAFNVMRNLGLGVSDGNYVKMTKEKVSTQISPKLNLNDWPIYSNEKYAYTLNYPKINFYNLNTIESTPENVQFDTEGPGSGLSIEVSKQDLSKAVANIPEQWTKQENKKLNDNMFMIFYHGGSDMVPGDWYKALIENNGNTFDITLHRSGNEELFNKIIETFKFID